jgi:uncharacterized metal-binding protein YceD (DUF177 family)
MTETDISRISWHIPAAIAEVPEAGRHFRFDAPDEARREIADLADLLSLDSLQADFEVTHRGDGLRVRGRVRARVGQACVVTLERLDNVVDEAVDLSFSPSVMKTEAELDMVEPDLTGPDPVEPMSGGSIDLAALAVEFMLLGLDPYPRKAGARFEPVVIGNAEEEAPPHPFAGLAALKSRSGSGKP